MSIVDTPDVFLPYQQELWSTIDRNQVTVAEKSRRTGYSWAVAAVAAERASLAKGEGGSDALYMGYEREMTREFIDYVADWARVFQMAASEVQEFVWQDPDRPEAAIGAFRIRFASSYEVIALPSVPRALRGKQGLVILDEAAFMDNLAEVLKAAFALLIWGGKVVVISTHNGETNPFNELVVGIRAGRLPYALLRLTFDEALQHGLYRRICYTAGRDWDADGEAVWRQSILDIYGDNSEEELQVIPNPSTGVYLPAPLLEARSRPEIPVLRWTAPPGFVRWAEHLREDEIARWCAAEVRPVLELLDPKEPHAFGEDFGRIRDLSVLWFLAITRTMERHTRLVVELRDVPFEQQRQILFFMLDGLPRLRAGLMDSGGNGAYLAEVTMQRYGSRIQPLQMTEEWYRQNMPPMKQAIEDAAFMLPRDREVLGDLGDLKLVRGVARVPERRRNDNRLPRHGDAAIAACLAYAASREEPMEYGYTAARPVLQQLPAEARGGWPIENELAAEAAGGRRHSSGLRGRAF